MKALVLARGRGTRMRAPDADARLRPDQADAASRGWKALMPIGRHRFLDFILSSLADAGCTDVGIVIGPDQRQDFAQYVDAPVRRRASITLIDQADARGSADAVVSAARWVSTAPFLVVNGDNLYPQDALRGLVQLNEPGLAAFERRQLVAASNIPADRIAAFAVLQLSPEGRLARIVEKPSAYALAALTGDVLVSMNAWRFDARVLGACREVDPSPRGEYELPLAVQLAVDRGVGFRAVPAAGTVLDLSGRSDVPEVERRLAGIEPRP